jgi:MFS family permease
MSLYTVVFLGSTPIGGPIAGWVGEHIGARVGLAAGGAIAIATGLVALSALAGTRPLTRRVHGPITAPVVDDHTG